MSPARVAFAAAALFALGRFFVTPTWPCAVVVSVSLALTFGYEVAREFASAQVDAAEEEMQAEFAARLATAEDKAATLRRDLDETRARVDSLAGRRALGG